MPLPEDGDPTGAATYDSPSFNPYDPDLTPDSVQPTALGPTPSSTTPEGGDTSGADGTPPEGEVPEADESEEAPPQFDPRWQDPFVGLLYLGRLEQTFNLFGHTFVVRTLTTEELAEVALIVAPYAGTKVETAVYQTAVVAGAVQSVDGQPLPASLGYTDTLGVRYSYVAKNWMPPVREQIYNRVFGLEMTVRKVLEALGEATG